LQIGSNNPQRKQFWPATLGPRLHHRLEQVTVHDDEVEELVFFLHFPKRNDNPDHNGKQN
jgi:hypothetical protein